jgi:hypothetical protein
MIDVDLTDPLAFFDHSTYTNLLAVQIVYMAENVQPPTLVLLLSMDRISHVSDNLLSSVGTHFALLLMTTFSIE